MLRSPALPQNHHGSKHVETKSYLPPCAPVRRPEYTYIQTDIQTYLHIWLELKIPKTSSTLSGYERGGSPANSSRQGSCGRWAGGGGLSRLGLPEPLEVVADELQHSGVQGSGSQNKELQAL